MQTQNTVTPINQVTNAQFSSETVEKLINLSHAASDDPTRGYLGAVHIKNGRAIATNGHIAVWFFSSELLRLETAIATEDLKLFKKSLFLNYDATTKTFNNGTITVKAQEYYKNLDTLVSGFRQNEKELVFENELKKKTIDMRFSFNPTLLVRITKALGLEKHKGFTLVPSEVKTRPMDVYVDGEWCAVIMPMRL